VNFLKHCFADAAKVKDNDWLDVKEQKIVPTHFSSKFVTSFADIPLYKQAGRYALDTMTPIWEHTYHVASTSAQNTLVAALKVNQDTIVYALNRSPGHHAFPGNYAGYCFFNNGALAAAYMEKHDKRVAVLDLDYHAGQGTQTIFWDNKDVCSVSIHMNPALDYPSDMCYEREVGAHNNVMNVCLDKGATWENKNEKLSYSRALEKACNKINEFGAHFLIIAFGGDTYKNDPDPSNIAGMCLEIADYEKMGAYIADKIRVPTLISQEGAYSQDVGKIVASFLKGIANSK
jgi:acetoin utilization deacetylase AcuC-like enzyme